MEHNFRVITHKQAWFIFGLGFALGMIIMMAVWATWPIKKIYIPKQQTQNDQRFLYI